jgi:non-ribosomal peptide synthetase component F
MGTHRVGVGRLDWDIRSDGPEVYAQKTSLAFVDSVWELFMPLSRGHRLVLIADHVVKDPWALIEALGKAEVTRLLLVPSLLEAMLDAEPALAAAIEILAKRGRAVAGSGCNLVSVSTPRCVADQCLRHVGML